ncbi:MAG: helix-turn-helix domain-containing protein [Defluviitaleaceae bacterium]|nr:helix-turn-helix domain-containing protein [Defluviitaleaceae bacterium]MCL2203784.1 helix-turn-helix domain-containing protein [Defluviitaleaceae bacterium]MCL2239253.1 helix-turn-helix domain-containing protein [Defluviitaleaceae bacterium]
MLYIAENLKALRKTKDWTQEEVAERLNVSPQSVSKWERGDTCPDITLLPALANLYKVSIGAMMGMDKINKTEARTAIFKAGHAHMRHTARAALCFIYYKQGETEKALACAQALPHLRESREQILFELKVKPDIADINAYLRFIMLGHENAQDKICVDFNADMLAMYTEHDLLRRIQALREETTPEEGEKYRRLPQVRIIDNIHLPPGRVRVNYCAQFLLDADFTDPAKAADAVMQALQKIAQR